jgi:hypothetical protein
MGILDELDDMEATEDTVRLPSIEARQIYEAALIDARRRSTIKYLA